MTATALLDAAMARRLERLTLITRRRLDARGQGDRRSVRKGSSLEFADFRHYVHGDDPNRVDWNVYARTGSLFVRLYEEEEVLNVHLILDTSRSMDWGDPNKLQYGRRLAASLGYVALNAANRLFVWSVEGSVPSFGPIWGRARANTLLTFLSALKPSQPGTPVVASFAPARLPDLEHGIGSASRRKASGLTILLSDLLSPSWEGAIARLAGNTDELVVLHVLAPQELHPDLGGDVRLIDRETGSSVPVTLNTDALRLYGEHLEAWQAKVQLTCQRHGARYVPVDTSSPIETVVFDTLRRRGVLR